MLVRIIVAVFHTLSQAKSSFLTLVGYLRSFPSSLGLHFCQILCAQRLRLGGRLLLDILLLVNFNLQKKKALGTIIPL